MTLFAWILFLHIVGMLAIFAAMALEWMALDRLRRADSPGPIADALHLLGPSPALNGIGAGLLLLTGAFLATRMAAWAQGWVEVALAGLILLGALGGALTGRRLRGLRRLAAAGTRESAGTLAGAARDPTLWTALQLRLWLALGIVLVMVGKPGLAGAATVAVLALIIGFVVARMTPVPLAAREVEGQP